jgi:hypothetical protein
VYDYDHYIDSNKLVIIGQLKKEDGKYTIVKVTTKPASTQVAPRVTRRRTRKITKSRAQ